MRRARGWFNRSSKNISNEGPPLDEHIADLSPLNYDGLKDVWASAYPYNDLLLALSIHKSFYKLVANVGLLKFTTKEVDQYRNLTYIFVQTFTYYDEDDPYVELCLYDRKRKMSLDEFCSTIGVTNHGTHKRITETTELHELYSRLCLQHEKTKQRSKISCFQNPAVRYFAYYLSTGVLARENTSTTPSLDLGIGRAHV